MAILGYQPGEANMKLFYISETPFVEVRNGKDAKICIAINDFPGSSVKTDEMGDLIARGCRLGFIGEPKQGNIKRICFTEIFAKMFKTADLTQVFYQDKNVMPSSSEYVIEPMSEKEERTFKDPDFALKVLKMVKDDKRAHQDKNSCIIL
jgi:hypothetical protein